MVNVGGSPAEEYPELFDFLLSEVNDQGLHKGLVSQFELGSKNPGHVG